MEQMLVPSRPMTTAERQRRFQAAHPGYDRRRKARQKPRIDSVMAALRLAEEAMAAEAKLTAPAAVPAPLAIPMMPAPTATRLALPAPVVDPVIAELSTLYAALASARAREALPARPMPPPLPAA